MKRPFFMVLVATVGLVGTYGVPASAEPCVPPRVLFVVDASSSMLGGIEGTTKWEAARSAVQAVLTAHGDNAEYGLMTFPGAAGQCATGEVKVDVAVGTAATINGELANLMIPGNNQTPAGQSLMAASKYTQIIDPNTDNYVIFITDGYQYCSIDGGAACVTQQDCDLMGVQCPSCMADQPDGCYCVQDWPVLGTMALAAAGVKTYVVGFGTSVNVKVLNKAAVEGGTALPNCDPNSNMASCYFQATVPAELTAALSQIVQQVVSEQCVGDCDLMGERTCTVNGWTDCDAPTGQTCVSTCGTDGVQECIDDAFGACSSEGDCGGMGGSATGAGGMGGSNPSGSGGSASGGVAVDDPEDAGGCGCRTAGERRGHGAWALLGLALLGARRRRSESAE